MELTKKDYKFINNTGQLPGVSDASVADWYGEWLKPKQFNPGVQRPLDMPVPGTQDFAGVDASVLKTLNSVKPGGEIDNLKTPSPTNSEKNHIRNIDIRLGFGGIVNTIGNLVLASNDYTHYDDFLASTKYDEGNVGGIKYIKESIDDRAKSFNTGKLPKFSKGYVLNGIGAGASAGAVAGPVGAGIGAVVGGLLGGIGESIAGDLEMYDYNKAMEKARLNTLKNRNGAITLLLRILNALKYGLQELLFFGAKDGKLPGYNIGKDAVFTSKGFTTNKEGNAYVSGQEGVMDKNGNLSVVPGPPDLKDDVLANIKPSDTVFRVQDMDYIYKTGDIQGAVNRLAASKMYNCGKIPKFAEGWLGNFIPSAMGAFAGLNLTLSAYRNNPYRPNTYVSNPYETEALTTLAGLRVNPYPIINLLRSAEARTNRAIDIAGGLSGGLRTAARLANLNTTQNNISNLLSNIQQQNNAYRANYAQAAINAGQASRQARMASNQWDLDYYSKAHAARNRGIQTGIANMLSQIQQYQANEFKRRQFNDTMDLYRADLKLRREQFNWMQNHSGLNISQNADPIKNPSSQYWNQLLPSEKWLALYNRGIIG